MVPSLCPGVRKSRRWFGCRFDGGGSAAQRAGGSIGSRVFDGYEAEHTVAETSSSLNKVVDIIPGGANASQACEVGALGSRPLLKKGQNGETKCGTVVCCP